MTYGMEMENQPDMFPLRATFTRQPRSGNTWATFLAKWPCNLHMDDNVDVFHPASGEEEVVHTLTGPAYRNRRLAPGDQLTVLVGADGRNHVQEGKAWFVVGRQNYRGTGDTAEMTVFVKEPR